MGGFPGYDAMVQAWAGFNSVNGNQKGGPVRVGLPMVDLGTGLNLAVGILMTLIERNRSGRGQFLEVTLYDAAVALQHPHATNWFHGGMTSELISMRTRHWRPTTSSRPRAATSSPAPATIRSSASSAP